MSEHDELDRLASALDALAVVEWGALSRSGLQSLVLGLERVRSRLAALSSTATGTTQTSSPRCISGACTLVGCPGTTLRRWMRTS